MAAHRNVVVLSVGAGLVVLCISLFGIAIFFQVDGPEVKEELVYTDTCVLVPTCLVPRQYWDVNATVADLEDCGESTVKGKTCAVDAFDLRPTQLSLAVHEAICKERLLEEKEDPLDYIAKHDQHIPIVIGPQGRKYITDHHHFVRGVTLSNLPRNSKILFAVVVENWSNMTEASFWRTMVENGYTWLGDEKGNFPLHFSALTDSIVDVPNDPYRFLAYLVRKNGAYSKSRQLYAEFRWAKFFRSKILLNSTDVPGEYVQDAPYRYCDAMPYSSACLPDELEQLERVLPRAIELAFSEEARELPGYRTDRTEVDALGQMGNTVCGIGFHFDEEHKRRSRLSQHR